MAIRTTVLAVQGIVDHDAAISLTPFIEVASALVDDPVESNSPLYSISKLELIERWLAAHFYKIRDQAVFSEQARGVGQTFQYRLGLNLGVTMYGQQAMLIDTDGNLAALSKRMEEGKKNSAGVIWMGTGNNVGDDVTT